MSGYAITEHAALDLEQITGYIARESPANARRVARKFADLFVRLALHPGIGHVRPELRINLRVIALYSYLVIYDPSTRPISILRVVHGARDLTQLPEDLA